MLCESCHGSAHGESPSTLALDNVENQNIQGTAKFPTGVNSSYALGTCAVCHTNQGNTWSPNVMYGGN
jgi:hypothetical protein